jgi:hypothetical protein
MILSQFGPFSVLEVRDNAPGDFPLRIPRIHAPDAVCGVFNPDLIIHNIYVNRLFGSAFHNDAVPARVFQLRGKASAEIAVAEPFDRIKHGREPLDFAPTGAGHKGTGKR